MEGKSEEEEAEITEDTSARTCANTKCGNEGHCDPLPTTQNNTKGNEPTGRNPVSFMVNGSSENSSSREG